MILYTLSIQSNYVATMNTRKMLVYFKEFALMIQNNLVTNRTRILAQEFLICNADDIKGLIVSHVVKLLMHVNKSDQYFCYVRLTGLKYR